MGVDLDQEPDYRDVLYVEELIGPDTVNTMPLETIEAFQDHGEVTRTIDADVDARKKVFADLEEAGVDMADVARRSRTRASRSSPTRTRSCSTTSRRSATRSPPRSFSAAGFTSHARGVDCPVRVDLRIDASALDYAIIAIYFVVVLGIGFVARRLIKKRRRLLPLRPSLPAWITGLAFVAANLGALEILGMAANGAQYGIATVHFYWIGAVPGDDLPRHRDDAVLLRRRRSARCPSTCGCASTSRRTSSTPLSFAVATVLISGVNLFALGAGDPR